MKISLLSFQFTTNYGAALQMYALKTYLNKQGHDVEVVDYINEYMLEENHRFPLKYAVKYLRNPKKSLHFALKIAYNVSGINVRRKMFNRFTNDEFKLSKKYRSLDEIKYNPPISDVYIVGSDQVWNPKITGGLDDVYFLDFTPIGKKRISYAASFGSLSNILGLEHEIIRKIDNFDYVSIREFTSTEHLKKYEKSIEIKTVLDPTFLLNKCDYIHLTQNMNKPKKKYIFVYMLEENPEFIKIVDKVSDFLGFGVIYNKRKKIFKNHIGNFTNAGPAEFINLINSAEFVVTNSFHGNVFSIILEKKFIVVPHTKNGDRTKDLSKILGFSNRVVESVDQISNDFVNDKIDFKNINQNINEYRTSSIEFLLEALNVD